MKTAFSFCLALSLFVSASQGAEPLTLAKTVPLPGVSGRFDHFAVDVKGQRIFVAALGNNTLEIIDVANGRHLHSIKGLSKPTGVVYLSDENLIGVANGNDGTFRVYDGRNFNLQKTITGLDDADNVRYDAKARRVYIGYGDGALAVLDPAKWISLATIKLPGHPESFQLDPNGSHIWVNIPDAKQITMIDRAQQKVIATWPMKQFQANFPMAYDTGTKRLFVGCRKPARLVAYDVTAGKPVADFPISGDTDDLFYDPKLNRLYVSCGEGFLDVFTASAPDKWTRLQKLPTSSGARTCFFSADLNQLYLAVPQKGRQQAELRIYATAP